MPLDLKRYIAENKEEIYAEPENKFLFCRYW